MNQTSSQFQLSPGYVAGLIDGEGWVGVTRHGLRLEIEMCDDGALVGLREMFPRTRIYRRPARTKQSRPTFRWAASGEEAASVLSYCMDHLVVKRVVAESAMGWFLTRDERYAKKARALNSRGG